MKETINVKGLTISDAEDNRLMSIDINQVDGSVTKFYLHAEEAKHLSDVLAEKADPYLDEKE